MSPSPLDAALIYAGVGWAVLPVAAAAKHPLTRHGVHDATTDVRQIRRWWLSWPDANVGVATGERSGVAVVDVDGRDGGRVSMAALHNAGHRLPPTRVAFTGCGYHLYFREPAGLAVPNTVGRLPNIGPVAGVDLRGDGGYVVAPPSVHSTGMTYTWHPGPPQDMADLPEWLWPHPPSPPPPPTEVRPCPRRTGASPYGHAALVLELEAVRRLVPGQRNDGLNRAAFALGTLVAGGELAEDLVVRELVAAAEAIGLGPSEARRTIGSGLRAGAAAPRAAPAARRP